MDRTRGRTRIMSYAEANRMRRDMLELATAGFMRLVQGEVTDYGVTWSIAAKKLSQYQEFQTYIDIFGAESAQRLFRWRLGFAKWRWMVRLQQLICLG